MPLIGQAVVLIAIASGILWRLEALHHRRLAREKQGWRNHVRDRDQADRSA